MNNTTMAHIGGEIAVLGGVVFYFHRKNSQLQEMIVELAQTNQKLIERVNGLEEDLNYLGQAMTAMQRRQPTPTTPAQAPATPVPPVTPATPATPALSPEQVQQMMAMMQTQQQPHATPVQETFAPPQPKVPEPAPEKTIIEPLQVYDNGDDLDKELASELGELESTKVVCEGDVCKLVE